MKRRKQAVQPQVIWHEEAKTLTLEGEPVLEYTLSWPELEGGGWGGRWINRYYAHLARSWRLRWEREVYWKACLSLVERRNASRPFTPWRGSLGGEVVCQEAGLLSLRLYGEEERGDGRPCRVRWGDVWQVAEGSPCPPKAFFRGQRRWKRSVTQQIIGQGRQAQQSGALFLDADWEARLNRYLTFQDFCLTPDGLEFSLPPCSIAPAVEGSLSFSVPRP